jgi:glycosyltransferase involved in cell wall biosynthesis
MRPRRILITAQSWALGGMESHALELAREFARRGLEVGVILPTAGAYDGLASAAAAAGIACWRLDTHPVAGRGNQLRGLLAFVGILRRWRPDVVHVHTSGGRGGLAVVLLTRALSRASAVLTEHDVPPSAPSRLHVWTRAVVDRSLDSLVAVSRRNADLRLARLPSRPAHFAVVLNGVPIPEADEDEVARDRASVRSELGIPDGDQVVGCLVRLADGKGLPTLLRAFAEIPAEQHARLLLVGDGPLRTDLEHLADELAISRRVVFAGHQTQTATYLHAMDVFALAVPAGSMSIALLEAMARGLPAVITFAGPEEPVIDGVTGLTAPPNNPAALSRALARLLGDRPLARVLGSAGASHVRREFSVTRVADDLLDVYQVRANRGLPERLRAGAPAPLRFETAAGLVK